MKIINVRLDEETVKKVDELAKLENRSRHNMLVELIKSATNYSLEKRNTRDLEDKKMNINITKL